MTFLRELLAAILGVFISFMIMFFVLIAIGSVIGSSFVDDGSVVVKKNSVLVLKFVSSRTVLWLRDSHVFLFHSMRGPQPSALYVRRDQP